MSEQTVLLGASSTTVEVVVQSIDSAGSHAAITIDTTQTRIVGKSVVPTVDLTAGTGIAKITFASVTGLSAGDKLIVKVVGTSGGVSFSPYFISVHVEAASSGGGGGLDAAQTRAALGLASANLDTQLGDIPTVSEFNARTKPTADYFDHTTDQVTTDSASRTASQANVSGLSTFNAASDTVDVGKINGNATSASNLQKSTSQIIQGTVAASPTPTNSSVSSQATFGATGIFSSSIPNDAYIGRLVVFTSGTLAGQATDITDYLWDIGNSVGFFTTTDLTSAPSANDTFVIV